MTYPVPSVPSVGDVATGAVLYTSDALSDADPLRIIIDPGRTLPYLGQPTPSARVVEYVNASGVHSGKAYYAKTAALVNIRPLAVPVVPVDCTLPIAAALAPLQAHITTLDAQIVSLGADVLAATQAGARAEWDRQAAGAVVTPMRVQLVEPRP